MRARYTVYLKDLLEDNWAKVHINAVLGTYPLYQPEKKNDLIPERAELNQKLLNHYKYREIGFETPGRFIDELGITMREIMPYYNERFKTIAYMAEIDDPFATVDYTEEYTETRTGEASHQSRNSDLRSSTSSSSDTSNSQTTDSGTNTSKVDSNSEGNDRHASSETPQTRQYPIPSSVDDMDYVDNLDFSNSSGFSSTNSTGTSSSTTQHQGTNSSTGSNETSGSSNSTSSSNDTQTINHKLTKKGAMGVTTFGHDMIEYRTAIIDVVDEIINDTRLNELFMNIW